MMLLPILTDADLARERERGRELREERRRQRRELKIRLLSVHPYCHYCGQRVSANRGTLDHVIPRSRGGADDPSNLVLSCRSCNFCKRNRTLAEWLDDLLRAQETPACMSDAA